MQPTAIAALRNDYSDNGISRQTLRANPIEQFALWFEQAVEAAIPEPNGMVIASIDPVFGVSQRTVLMKSFGEDGLFFYTNYHSRKATQLDQQPQISCLFAWLALQRQVCFQGQVQRASKQQSQRYFASRPRASQLGAWASRQSEIIAHRDQLENRYRQIEQQYQGMEVPLPPFWGGFQVLPLRIEFWQGRSNRLHDRLVYSRTKAAANHWQIERLSP